MDAERIAPCLVANQAISWRLLVYTLPPSINPVSRNLIFYFLTSNFTTMPLITWDIRVETLETQLTLSTLLLPVSSAQALVMRTPGSVRWKGPLGDCSREEAGSSTWAGVKVFRPLQSC